MPGCTKIEGEEKELLFPDTSLPMFVWPFSRSVFLLLAIDDLREDLNAYIQFTYLANTSIHLRSVKEQLANVSRDTNHYPEEPGGFYVTSKGLQCNQGGIRIQTLS